MKGKSESLKTPALYFALQIVFLFGIYLIVASIGSNGNSTEATTNDADVSIEEKLTNELMTAEELGIYLGISNSELEMILPKSKDELTQSMVPYIKIGFTYYFPVKAIDRWLTETEAIHFHSTGPIARR